MAGGYPVNIATAPPLSIGAATESSLQSILSVLTNDVNLSGTVWYDFTVNPYVYYIRREIVNDSTGSTTIQWETPTGGIVTPNVNNLHPVSTVENIVNNNKVYTATTNAVGYSTNDILIHTFGIDISLSTPTIAYNFWLNASTNIIISAPSSTNLTTVTTENVSVLNWPSYYTLDGTAGTGINQVGGGTGSIGWLSTIASYLNTIATEDSGSKTIANLPPYLSTNGNLKVAIEESNSITINSQVNGFAQESNGNLANIATETQAIATATGTQSDSVSTNSIIGLLKKLITNATRGWTLSNTTDSVSVSGSVTITSAPTTSVIGNFYSTNAAAPAAVELSYSGNYIDPRQTRNLTSSDVVSIASLPNVTLVSNQSINSVQSGVWSVGVSSLPTISLGNSSNNIGNVSITGTVSLPTGAATAANQPTINVDGGSLSHITNFPSSFGVTGTFWPTSASLPSSVSISYSGAFIDPRSIRLLTASDQVTIANTTLPLPTGAATDSTLQSILAAISATVSLSGTVWFDATTTPPTYYVRRELDHGGTISVVWETPSGTTANSITVSNLQPVSNAENITNTTLTYISTAGGTGYTSGQLLIYSFGIDTQTTPPSLAYSAWFNANTNSFLSTAPNSTTYTSTTTALSAISLPLPTGAAADSSLQSILSTLSGVVDTDGSSESLVNNTVPNSATYIGYENNSGNLTGISSSTPLPVIDSGTTKGGIVTPLLVDSNGAQIVSPSTVISEQNLNAARTSDSPLFVSVTGNPDGDWAGVDLIEQTLDPSTNIGFNTNVLNWPKHDNNQATILSDCPSPINQYLALGQSVIIDTIGYQSMDITTQGSISANVYISNDQLTWTSLNGTLALAYGMVSAGLIPNNNYIFPCNARYIRITASAAGSFTAYLRNATTAGVSTQNMVFINGSAIATAGTGILAIGGPTSPGNARNSSPVVTSGTDLNNIVRTTLTDTSGRGQISTANINSGITPVSYKNTPILSVEELTNIDSVNNTELLKAILTELRVLTHMQSIAFDSTDEPSIIRNDYYNTPGEFT